MQCRFSLVKESSFAVDALGPAVARTLKFAPPTAGREGCCDSWDCKEQLQHIGLQWS
jgi:hypothetical protein